MKKLFYVLLSFTILLLAGCEDFDQQEVQELGQNIINDEKLSQYVDSLSFVDLTEGDYDKEVYYNLELFMFDEFDSLSNEEKIEFFRYVNNLLGDLNPNYKEQGTSEIKCDEDYECTVGSLIFKTTNHTYKQDYNTSETYVINSYFDGDEEIFLTEAPEESIAEQEPDVETEVVKTVEEVEETLSQEFLTYNEKYYQAFKNSLDLIASNFELMSDGYGTPDLVDDLIVWTTEFDELLDVYEQNANPTNEMDKNLYDITIKMITEQSEANRYIIAGLKNYDDQSLLIAGEYISTVADLYLEGYNLLP